MKRKRRMTGFGIPWASIQWENIKDQDKLTAKAVIAFLEDRQVLFGDRHLEDQYYCLLSVFEIRAFLTERLTTDDVGDDLATVLKTVRAACREFIDAAGPEARNFYVQHGELQSDPFSLALGDLRSRVGIYIDVIARQHKLEMSEELAQILPPPAEADDNELSWMPGFG